MHSLLLLGLLACGGGSPVDADYDGFPAGEDCDDADAFVYPGAPDDPGDGIDADCDGSDPQHGFVGTWELSWLSAMYSSFQLVDDGSESGGMTLTSELDVEMDASIGIDPDLVGYELEVPIQMSGWVSPLPGDDMSVLRVEGSVLAEDSYVELECAASGDELDCVGVLKALEVNLVTEAVFVRAP
jgi:hypothetical protein